MKWVSSGGGDFEQPPVGTHVAVCTKVIDIGTHKSEYQGQATIKRQCVIGWELTNELMTTGDYAGKPFTVSKFYTASLSEKANLRRDLQNWRGRDFTEQELQGFESRNILGKPCMISVIMNDKNKARVAAIMALPKGSAPPKQVNPSVYFSLDEFDQKAFDALSDGFKKLIMESPEYKHATGPVDHDPKDLSDMDSDIPF